MTPAGTSMFSGALPNRFPQSLRQGLAVLERFVEWVPEGNLMLRISGLEMVRLWSRSLSVRFPPTRVLVPKWSLDVVLSALKKPPSYDKDLCLIEMKRLIQRTYSFETCNMCYMRTTCTSWFTCHMSGGWKDVLLGLWFVQYWESLDFTCALCFIV